MLDNDKKELNEDVVSDTDEGLVYEEFTEVGEVDDEIVEDDEADEDVVAGDEGVDDDEVDTVDYDDDAVSEDLIIDEDDDLDLDVIDPAADHETAAKNLPWLWPLIAMLAVAALAGGLYFALTGAEGSLGGLFNNTGGAAARVNGRAISQARLDAEMARIEIGQPGIFEDNGVDRNEVRSQVLDELVNQELLLQKAAEEGVTISDDEVDAEIEQFRAQLGDDYEATLAQYNYTEADIREEIRFSMIRMALMDKLAPKDLVTDAMIREFYEDNKDDMFVEEAGKRVSHILFSPDDEALAEEILAQIKGDDGADFAELAIEYSQDSGSAENGGDLGWIAESSEAYVPEFKEAVDALSKGGISDLVQTTYGYHIVIITDEREESTIPFADVEEDITNMLFGQEQSTIFQNLMETLHSDAEIEILDKAVLDFRAGISDVPDQAIEDFIEVP